MASPNYLQYENTYQKYKKICHNKDVSNFRDSKQQQMYTYDDEGPSGNLQVVGDNANGKSNNTMSSDDEGGFRRDLLNMRNQFNNDSNGNASYSTKEVEPLLHAGNSGDLCQITKVRVYIWRYHVIIIII